jgi:hypothetical protein
MFIALPARLKLSCSGVRDGYLAVFHSPSCSVVASACNGPRNRVEIPFSGRLSERIYWGSPYAVSIPLWPRSRVCGAVSSDSVKNRREASGARFLFLLYPAARTKLSAVKPHFWLPKYVVFRLTRCLKVREGICAGTYISHRTIHQPQSPGPRYVVPGASPSALVRTYLNARYSTLHVTREGEGDNNHTKHQTIPRQIFHESQSQRIQKQSPESPNHHPETTCG